MILKTCMLSALAFMIFQPLIAQGEFEGDPIEANTFPPELVMRYQQAIGLSEEQRDGDQERGPDSPDQLYRP